jgi:hypothetical protein
VNILDQMSYYKPVVENIYYMQTDFYEQMLKYYMKVKKESCLEILNDLLDEIERDINLSESCNEQYKNGMQWTLTSYRFRVKSILDSYNKILKPTYKQQTLF